MSDSSSDVPDWRKGTPKSGDAPDWRKASPKPEAPKTPPGKPAQAWRQDAGDGHGAATPAAKWKQETGGPAAPSAGWSKKHKFAALAGGLFATLVALILVVLWLIPPKQACLFLVGAGYEENLAVPHNVYGRESLAAFSDLCRSGPPSAPWLSSPLLKLKQEPTEFRIDLPWDRGLDSFPEPTVILYFALHGGADGQGPYLLANDADLREETKEKQRLRLDAVLTKLAQLPAEKKKVLILDATQVPSHWSLGMMHNDFARGLAERKSKIEEIPNLVVLSASDIDQRSWVSDEWRKTIFAHYLLEGLKGAADKDGTGRINALKLHQYVAENVERWVRANRGAELQTPVLLGGEDRARGIELVVVKDRYQPPDAQAVPAFESPKELREAWAACRKLEKMVPPPVSYAPQPWRLYQELLLRYDALVRAGDQRKAPDLRKELLRMEEELARAQRLDLPSGQNAVALPQALGQPSTYSEKELTTMLNDLWRLPPTEQEKKWQQLQAGATDKSARQVLKQRLGGMLVDRAAEAPRDNLAKAVDLVKLINGTNNQRPTEVHYLAMLQRDLPQKAPPAESIQLALRVRRLAEEVALSISADGSAHSFSELVYPWIRDKVHQADLLRRRGEDRLFATDPESWAQARKDLQAAETQYLAARKDAEAVRNAFQVRNEVLATVPFYARWQARRRQAEEPQLKAMEDLCQEVHYLSRQLETPAPERIAGVVALDGEDQQPASIAAKTDQVRKAFQALEDEFAQHCKELRNVALPSVWRDTDAVLQVPRIDADVRMELMRNARAISRTFHLESAGGKSSDTPGVTREKNTDLAKSTAQRESRMALAALERRWFNDPLFQGPESGYAQVLGRIRSFPTEEKWWLSLGRASEEIGQRFRKMPEIINQRTAESKKQNLRQAAGALLVTDRLARLVDGAVVRLVDVNATDERRKLTVHDFFLAEAERTLNDHWFAEDPAAQPYYQFAGNLFVEDARSLVDGKAGELTPQQRKERLEAVTKLQEELARPGTITVAGPARVEITSEPQLAVDYQLQTDPKGYVPPGFPVVWLETGKALMAPADATSRLIREIGGTAPPNSIAVRLVPDVPKLPPTTPSVERTTAALRGVYRGQRIDKPTAVSLHRLPETVLINWPPPPTAGLAVTGPAEIHELFGPSNGAVSIVLDVSGSMGPTNAELAKTGGKYTRRTPCKYHEATGALRKVLEKLPKGATFSVWVYAQAFLNEAGQPLNTQPNVNDTIKLLRPPSRWDPTELGPLMDSLEDLIPWNETPLVRAMVRAKEAGFPKDFKGFKTLLVLTDGDDSEFSKDKELQARYGTKEIPKFIQEEFKDAGIAITMVGFRIANKKEREAFEGFRVVEKLPLPGKMLTTDDVAKLVESLERGLRQRLRFQIEREVGGALKDMPEGGWDVSRNSESNRWVQLEPGPYKVRVLTNRVVEQRVQLAKGDYLLVSVTPDGLGFERVLYGDDFRFRPQREAEGWLLTNLQNQINVDRSLEMMMTLENRQDRAARMGTLQQVRPREAWFEIKPVGTEAPVAIRWGPLAGYPAPAWTVQTPAWPNRAGAAEAARSTVTAYWSWEAEAPVAATVRRPANQDFINAFKNIEAQVGQDAGDKALIESVDVEDREVESQPGKKEKLSCLVVRIAYPAGKPVWAQIEGLDRQGDAPGSEHRFYEQANKYTGVFWPVTRDAAANTLRAVHLVSLDRFKKAKTTSKVELKLDDLPDARTRPKSVPELIEVK